MITLPPPNTDPRSGPGGSHGGDADPGRGETENERHDRNWNDILQELRVIQTGTQILTGFLLTLPFQQRFGLLAGYEVASYLALVVTAALATILALSPVALHRTLFRHRAKGVMVVIANRLLKVVNRVPPLTYEATITVEPDEEGAVLGCLLAIEGVSSIISLAKPVLEYLAPGAVGK